VQPLIESPPELHTYEVGSWGPEAVSKLVAGYPGWREPWLES